MHAWSSSSTSLWLGLFHVAGIRIMRRWGGDFERKERAQATEVCIASIHLSLVPHWMRERDSEEYKIAAVPACMSTERPVFSAVYLLELCHREILSNVLQNWKTGATPEAGRERLPSYKDYCIYAVDVFFFSFASFISKIKFIQAQDWGY